MPTSVTCPNPACAKASRVADHLAGLRIRCGHCGHSFVAPSTAGSSTGLPAQTAVEAVGRFQIRQRLGAGAFGTVYRAYDPHLDREVALKIPNPAVFADPKRLERFLREARAAAQLRHPNIVPVFDAGRAGDSYYIASAFIDGRPLSEAVEPKGMELRRAVRIVRELAEAADYAHKQGVVHRDIKPANVMLDRADRPHLMDFGLAARADGEAKLTNDGALLGTPAYMAPEQAAGQQGEAKPAADQYALGVLLYELMTGVIPFTGRPELVLFHVVNTPPASPRTHRPYLPRALETICLKALAKEPGQRYESCQDLADDLRAWLSGEPIAARRLWKLERSLRFTRRHPVAAGGTLVGVLIFVATVAALTGPTEVQRRRAERAEALVEEWGRLFEDQKQQTATALSEAARGRTAAADARTEAMQARTELAAAVKNLSDQNHLLEAKVKEASEKLKPVRSPRPGAYETGVQNVVRAVEAGESETGVRLLGALSEDMRGWEYNYLLRACTLPKKDIVELKNHSSSISGIAFDPDVDRIITGSSDKRSRIFQSTTGEPIISTGGHSEAVLSVIFSPDGRRVATGGRDKVAYIWDALRGDRHVSLIGHSGIVSSLAFSPDGIRIVTGSWDNTARIWFTRTGAGALTLEKHRDAVSSVAFSPDGTRVLTGSWDKTARLWISKTGDSNAVLTGHTDKVYCVAFGPDGKQIATGSSDNTVRIWNAETLETVVVLTGHTNSVASVAFSPDGTRIVTGSWDTTARLWNARNGAFLLSLSGHTGPVLSVAFSRDSHRIATASDDGTVRIWDGTPVKP